MTELLGNSVTKTACTSIQSRAAVVPRSASPTAVQRRNRQTKAAIGLALLGPMTFAVVQACDVGGDLRPPPPGFSTGAPGPFAPCPDGAAQSCHIPLGEQNGVLSCYDGVQTCQGGAWGECTDGAVSKRASPRRRDGAEASAEKGFDVASSLGQLSLTSPTACTKNPCDPSCQVFVEQPDGGLSPSPAGPLFNWPVGDLDDYPPSLVNKGLQEPCDEGTDCQFDHYCYNPVSGNCAHDKCGVGVGLDSACDPCVMKVCALDPACCTPTYSGSCSHAPCVTGGKLKSSCDGCVQTICNADPYCCKTQWDAQCVAEVTSLCNKSCASGSWSPSCVDKVYSVCGAFCQQDPGCAHDKCNAGAALAGSCDACVSQICAVDAYCCATAWDSLCVGEVASVCGEGCGPEGACAPWLPGRKDATCPGVDLTAGVPCQDTIPVCNHGNMTAPAGIKIIHFPASAQQFPECSPDQSHPQMQTCTTTMPIPPGECVSVTGCPGLTGDREVMVNPPGAGHVSECTCVNNWSLYSDVACGPPSCAAATSEVSLKKIALFVSMDRSASMQSNGWAEAMSAMTKFFADPASAGLGVALRFWPDNQPTAGCEYAACSVSACSNPLVPLGTLTVDPAPGDAHEQALLNAINSKSPGGGTPTYPALGGATQWATAYQAANPGEQAVVVFITDGDPSQCNTNLSAIAALAGDAWNQGGVPTYVIGIEGAGVTTVNTIAQAGGTGQALFVQKGMNNSQVEAQLLAALSSIRGDAASCDLELAQSGVFSPNDVAVIYTPGDGQDAGALDEVAGPGACGVGWYFDNPANPTKLTLCPPACAAVRSDPGAKVEVNIGCPPAFQPATFKHVYTGTCPQGTRIQWGFFAYDTETPGDSGVVFATHTSNDAADFSAPLVTLATATASPNSQVCAMGGPAPCPVDMFNKLGGLPDAQNEYLELVITASPSTDASAAPTINAWEITYACPASE